MVSQQMESEATGRGDRTPPAKPQRLLTPGRDPSRASRRPRPLVASSWSRCEELQDGRDPTRPPPVLLTGDALHAYRSTHPLSATLHVCRQLLSQAAADSQSVFAVGDAAGLLLWVDGHRATRSRAEHIGFVEGALWSEAEAGTNAPGTALALGRPLQILAGEHFNQAVRSWSCAAAPIRDPDSGRILGFVDLTGNDDIASPYALALVRATASAIEAQLGQRQALADAAALDTFAQQGSRSHCTAVLVSRGGRVLDTRGQSDAAELGKLARGQHLPLDHDQRLVIEPVGATDFMVMWLVDSKSPMYQRREHAPARLSALGRDSATLDVDGRVIKLSPRHSEIVVVMSLSEKGLTARDLAASLSLNELSTATIRMDMSRLRSVLGDELLASQPYVLRRQLRSDLHVVQDLIAAGRARDALSLYPGPLLPQSQAPVIVEQRMLLEQGLRDAVLESHDACVLRDWVNASWGALDGPAWDSLADALPSGSPQQAAASLRATALHRESFATPRARPTAWPARTHGARPAAVRSDQD